MNKIYNVAVAVIVAALSAGNASVAQAGVWSLDSCISYAHAHNITVLQRTVDTETARYGVIEAQDRFLPSASAYANQSFDFGRGLTSENVYANRNTSAFSVGAQLNVPLFQGLRAVRGLEYAKVNLLAALEQVESAKDDITLNIIAQYLQVLYSRETLRIAENQAALSAKELDRRKELLAAGKIPELDMLQAESQLAADRMTAVNAEGDLKIALTELAQMLQLPYDPDFDIEPINDDMKILPAVDDVFANAMANNHSIRAARYAVSAAEHNVKVTRSGYLPTLSFNAGLGTNYYHVSGFDNAGFGSQMRDNFARQLGFSLSIPLFDAFGTRNSVRRAQAAVVTAGLQADDARLRLYNAISQAHVRATTARHKIEAGEAALRTAEASFRAMQDKYNYGRATATEFEEAKTALFRANLDLLQARYESMLRTRILDFYNRPA